MMRKIRSLLSKLNFMLNRNPRVIPYRNTNFREYIPDPYDAVLILSADFELAWAWRYARGFENPKEQALKHARTSRRNIPLILNLCDKYDIPITWATVGHLFLEKCFRSSNLVHGQLERIPHHHNQYWIFDKGDWFDDDPCTIWEESPEYYAPDIIKMILGAEVRHEIGCHTFSHIDCRDNVCPDGVITGELKECRKQAHKYGLRLESFFHPGHTIGNLAALKNLGFTSFRTDYHNILGYPRKHLDSLWELSGTMEFVMRKEWSIGYHIYRYKTIIERAIRYKRVCCFWFHPSIDTLFFESVLPQLFEFIALHRDKLYVATTSEYVHWLQQYHHV